MEHLYKHKIPFALASNALRKNIEAKISYQKGCCSKFIGCVHVCLQRIILSSSSTFCMLSTVPWIEVVEWKCYSLLWWTSKIVRVVKDDWYFYINPEIIWSSWKNSFEVMRSQIKDDFCIFSKIICGYYYVFVGWKERFSVVIGSDEVKAGKPAPDM